MVAVDRGLSLWPCGSSRSTTSTATSNALEAVLADPRAAETARREEERRREELRKREEARRLEDQQRAQQLATQQAAAAQMRQVAVPVAPSIPRTCPALTVAPGLIPG